MSDDFMMTRFEKSQMALLERIADTLDLLNARIEALTEAIDDSTDAKEEEKAKFPLIPTTGGQMYFQTTPYTLGNAISGIGVNGATLTNSTSPDNPAKKLK